MTDILPPENASLDELLAAAKSKYAVEFQPMRVGDISLDILQLADMDAYIERIAAALPSNPDQDMPKDIDASLPFWAKIWNTSVLTAYVLQKFPAKGPYGPRTMLEIGAGVGVVGLVAAKLGFKTTITDNNPDAVLFSRINIMQNGLAETARAELCDFTADGMDERYDLVVGSEVLYKEDTYRPLTKFLLKHLKDDPGAEIVLSKEYSRKAAKFFKLAEREFHMDSKEIGFKNEGAKHLCTVYRLKPRKTALPGQE